MLISLFDTSKHLIDNLISDLMFYSQKYDGSVTKYNALFTVDQYLNYLIDLRERELNDKLKNNLVRSSLVKDQINQMKESLNRQIHSFNESQAYLDSRFKYI